MFSIISRTKLQYLWVVEFNGKEHKIELLHSTISGMKRVRIDGNVVFEKRMMFDELNHSIPMGGHMITIEEELDQVNFKIDEEPFALLYLREKNKSNFKHEGTANENKEDELQKPKNNSKKSDIGCKSNTYSNSKIDNKTKTKVSSQQIIENSNKPLEEKFDWNSQLNYDFDEEKVPNQISSNKPMIVKDQNPTPIIDFLDCENPVSNQSEILKFTNYQKENVMPKTHCNGNFFE